MKVRKTKEKFIKRLIGGILIFCMALNLSIKEVQAVSTYRAIDIQVESDGYGDTNYILDSNGEVWKGFNDSYEKLSIINNAKNIKIERNYITVTKNDNTLWDYFWQYENRRYIEKEHKGINNVNYAIQIENESRLILKNNGEVFVYGINKYGEYNNNNKDFKYIKVDGLKDIKNIYTFETNDTVKGRINIAVNKNDEVFVWGISQTGGDHYSPIYTHYEPKKVNDFKNIKDFIKVEEVIDGMYVRKIYALDREGQGYLIPLDYLIKGTGVKKENPFNLKVDSIIKTTFSMFVKDIYGNYYGKGEGYFGEFFTENPQKKTDMVKLDKLKGFKKIGARCGIDQQGKVYSWGQKTSQPSEEGVYLLDKVNNIKEIFDYGTSAGRHGGYMPVPGAFVETSNGDIIYFGEESKNDNFINLSKETGFKGFNRRIVAIYEDYRGRRYGDVFLEDKEGNLLIADLFDSNGKFNPIKIEGVKKPIKITSDGRFRYILSEDGKVFRNDSDNRTRFIDNNVKDFYQEGSSVVVLNTDGKVKRFQYSYSEDVYTEEYLKGCIDIKEFIATTESHENEMFIARKNDGSIWGYGSNYWGELGLGNTESKHELTQLTIDKKIKKIINNESSLYGLTEAGDILVWGKNHQGELLLDNKEDVVKVPTKNNKFSRIKDILLDGVPILVDSEGYLMEINRGETYDDSYQINKLTGLGKVQEYKKLSYNTYLGKVSSDVYKIYNTSDGKVKTIKNIAEINGQVVKKKDGKVYGIALTSEDNILRLSSECFSTELKEVKLGTSTGVSLDINGDGKIDIADISMIALHYNKTQNIEKYDLNLDGIVDIYDLIKISINI